MELIQKNQEVVVRTGLSTKREEKQWSRLPDIILDRVFGYLSRDDQDSASRVCRQWSRAFENPNLWRKIDVSLSDATVDSLQKVLQFTKRYGHHMRNLEIEYHRTRLRDNPELERPLIALIDEIHGRAELTHFNLQNFNPKRVTRASSILGQQFLTSVLRFLRRQRALTEVVMTCFYLQIEQGNRILHAVAKGSGAILKTLMLENFFSTELDIFRNLNFLSILGKFQHLEKVFLNYHCVSEEVIQSIVHNCAGSLRSLSIRCDDDEALHHTIGNQVWEQLRSDCPNVLIDFIIGGNRNLETLMRVVPSHVPLRCLEYWTWEWARRQNASDPIKFITHVLTSFKNTLEDLELHFDDTIPMLDILLKEFLPSLKKLTRLDIHAKFSDTFIEEVNAMQEEKIINLSKFRAMQCDRTQEEILDEHIPALLRNPMTMFTSTS